MSYVDGFVLAVPSANKQKFIDHARQGDSVFMEYGATRVLECWGDDVPEGKQTGLPSRRESQGRRGRWCFPGSNGRTKARAMSE